MGPISILTEKYQLLLKEKFDEGEFEVIDSLLYKRVMGDKQGERDLQKVDISFDSNDIPYCLISFPTGYQRVPLDWCIYLSEKEPPGYNYVLGRKNGKALDIRQSNIVAIYYSGTFASSREKEDEMVAKVRDMIVDGKKVTTDRLCKRFQISTEEARKLMSRGERWAENGIISS